MTMQDFLPILNLVLTGAVVVGGILAFRRGYSKEIDERQVRLIGTLKDEVKVLHGKVDDLTTERATQDRVIATIRYLLKQYGLRITIAGDMVTCSDVSGKNKRIRIANPLPQQQSADDEESDVV